MYDFTPGANQLMPSWFCHPIYPAMFASFLVEMPGTAGERISFCTPRQGPGLESAALSSCWVRCPHSTDVPPPEMGAEQCFRASPGRLRAPRPPRDATSPQVVPGANLTVRNQHFLAFWPSGFFMTGLYETGFIIFLFASQVGAPPATRVTSHLYPLRTPTIV